MTSIQTSLFATSILAGSIFAAAAHAQSAQVPAPPQQKPVIIENATIHANPGDPGSVIESGSIAFENGVITHLGAGEAPASLRDALRIDAKGMHIWPGLISADTMLGLTETGSVDVTHDYREIGEFTPEVRAAVAVNPDTDLIPVTRANGILLALSFPQGGLVAGRCSSIRLDGWTWEEMAIDAEAGLVINWPRMEAFSRWGGRGGNPEEQRSRAMENIEQIDRFFDEAAAYFRAKANDPTLATDLRFEAMHATISGDKPIFIRASSAGQIESAVSWAIERELKPVIVGGTEADEATPILLKHDVPVIISGTHRLPGRRHDAYDAPFTLPLRLHEAGVRFAIASGQETPHERSLPYSAAMAASYGLPVEAALHSQMLGAAEILGIDDAYGSLEVGKSATLIITTGNPLEITTETLRAFIDGREIDLGSRHKRLYEKYREKYRQRGLAGE